MKKGRIVVNENLIINASNGKFAGVDRNGIISYKGIPYAKPPVGELRWRAPQEPEYVDEVKLCDEFGYAAVQPWDRLEKASWYKQSEDCLTLNIWTAGLGEEKKKPVMVWIHGGAYCLGGTADPIYSGYNFVEAHQDMIMVTINYRVGIYGFIDFTETPGGESYTDTNLGILDQIAALKWIHENIAKFGGDPDNVTIFGESAGAVSVGLLMIIPEANKYFNRVIEQSDSFVRGALSCRQEGLDYAARLLKEAGVSTMEELLAIPEKELMRINEDAEMAAYCPGSINDGSLWEDPWEAIKKGYGKDIDLLIGTNSHEYNYTLLDMGDRESFVELFTGKFERNKAEMNEEELQILEDFFKIYEGKQDKFETIVEYYNESNMRVPSIVEAVEHQKSGGNTYMYYWKYPSSIKGLGACHAIDISYVFNNLQEEIFTGQNPSKELAVKVQKAWVNFAKTGNPSFDDIEWPQYDEKTRKTMIIDVDTQFRIVEDPMPEPRKLIEKVFMKANKAAAIVEEIE